MLIVFGCVLVTTAGESVATKIGAHPLYFIHKHLIYLPIAIAVMLIIAIQNVDFIKKLSIFGLVFFGILLIMVQFFGAEIKGAKRWLSFGSIAIQPSEQIKPFFAVAIAWMLELRKNKDFKGILYSIILYVVVVSLLLAQPDLGMVMMITLTIVGQFFVAGIPLSWLITSSIGVILLVFAAYVTMPHVTQRIENFLSDSKANYQVNKSIMAFSKGKLYGVGPGEGAVKHILPDCHADFIFSVAAEEFGVIACVVIASIFIFIVIVNLLKIATEKDYFKQLAITGLILQFGVQACFNIAVTMNLLPTKGMTLPFISYGGSSMIAVAITFGMILALSKRQVVLKKYKENIW
ncbi:MAG: putative lipid II flippase FtsW [Rickettsiaceae bacterium]|nr:putative lipid II flippase FtsW [Rickettsiaceae bacterium]